MERRVDLIQQSVVWWFDLVWVFPRRRELDSLLEQWKRTEHPFSNGHCMAGLCHRIKNYGTTRLTKKGNSKLTKKKTFHYGCVQFFHVFFFLFDSFLFFNWKFLDLNEWKGHSYKRTALDILRSSIRRARQCFLWTSGHNNTGTK